MKIEIVKNIDDVEVFIKLIDELICGSKSYEILKKMFWHVNIFQETKSFVPKFILFSRFLLYRQRTYSLF